MREKPLGERRQYIRLGSVFPVEIVLPQNRDKSGQRIIQGFTHDVSLGGLCITVNDPNPDFISSLENGVTALDLCINLPVSPRPAEATVRLVWHEISDGRYHKKLRMGISYEKITPENQKRIIDAARRIKWLPRIAVFFILILLCFLGFSQYNTLLLVERNRSLIESFHKIQEVSDVYREGMGRIDKKLGSVKEENRQKEKLINDLSEKLSSLPTSEKAPVEEELKKALDEKKILEEELEKIGARQKKTASLLSEVEGKRRELKEATVKNMCGWLKTHQNKRTGLVMSFEGDPSMDNWAFTYDQSLAAQVFLISGDTEKAQSILSFFDHSAKKEKGGFCNAYNAMSGEPSEHKVNMGPNLWIGIAAAHYTEKTKDKKYLRLAEDIADWAISLKDKDGGMKGGPDFQWYSTEHNLDAYALFSMLEDITGKKIYEKEKLSTLRWIKDFTYSEEARRVTRGKGDATIATDTLAWSIAAIGPAALLKESMDPEGIIKFAEEHCVVSTDFQRPDGIVVKVTGFDFGKARHMARGGVISTEWTAQMAMAFRVMAAYYRTLGKTREAENFTRKAQFYLDELDKMVISSPSKSGQGAGCLPYASQPNAETGHGWRTPEGRDTGSVSGTAYAIFAKRDYNPLSFY